MLTDKPGAMESVHPYRYTVSHSAVHSSGTSPPPNDHTYNMHGSRWKGNNNCSVLRVTDLDMHTCTYKSVPLSKYNILYFERGTDLNQIGILIV